jgi:hypothetical protein
MAWVNSMKSELAVLLDDQVLGSIGQRPTLDHPAGVDSRHEARQCVVVSDRVPDSVRVGSKLEYRLGIEAAAAAAYVHLQIFGH